MRVCVRRLPIEGRREVLGDEALVVRAEAVDVHGLVALAVEVVRVERAHRRERALVLFVREMRVCALSVPSARARPSVNGHDPLQR